MAESLAATRATSLDASLMESWAACCSASLLAACSAVADLCCDSGLRFRSSRAKGLRERSAVSGSGAGCRLPLCSGMKQGESLWEEGCSSGSNGWL